MTDVRSIEVAPGLVFDAEVDGDPAAPLVLMLHGFGVSRHFWRAQVATLAAAGFFAVAPNQRGYAVGARPRPDDLEQYRIDRMVEDALAMAEALGHGGRRFHLVGHDFGGSVAWLVADRAPQRLASLAMLSRPHPASFARAMASPDGEQARRSSHHKWFQDADAVERLLADDAAWLRTRLSRQGVPPDAIGRHLSVLGNPSAMAAALAWYRARGERSAIGPTRVPTLYVWGDADDTVGRAAAEGTAEFIAAPYTFAELPGVGHYPADQVPQKTSELLLAHLARHPA